VFDQGQDGQQEGVRGQPFDAGAAEDSLQQVVLLLRCSAARRLRIPLDAPRQG